MITVGQCARRRDGSYRFTDTDGWEWRVRRLPVKSRGWHAELQLGTTRKPFWTATRYSARTLREVFGQMSDEGIKVASK
jgi:hypothetical protein